MRILLVILCLSGVLAGCGGSSAPSTGGKNPCELLCEKWNSCRGATAEALPCPQVCVYGGNFAPGIGPSPYCPNLAAQTTCVANAVQASCTAYDTTALAGCPACPPVTGGPCQTDLDCARYDGRFKCDVSRPGGYCTAPCRDAFDCSEAGPEVCSAATPSFDPFGNISTTWCQLGCASDALCRTDQGYTCQSRLCTAAP
ncbi:MAG TPA: hypothetical protein VHO67_17050 [Polyangia bacterium]|nr:hypothetical protein [Polyangia bacterium]